MLASLTESAIFALTDKELAFASLTRICKSRIRYKKTTSEKPTNIGLCDTDAVLNQLSYQVNWELVIRILPIELKR